MSFRDLEAGSHKPGRGAQPKQHRDEDSSFERHIKANIQEMQECVRLATEQLGRSQRTGLSKRMAESLDTSLERSRDLAQETEQLFRDWTVHLAGEPTERHRKKFSYDKLEKVFREEVAHLKDAGRRAIDAHQEGLRGSSSGPVECRSMVEAEGSAQSDEEQGLLDDSSEVSGMGHELAIENRIAHEREEGIRRIQSQVSEVNQIFRDLASIVHEQGQQFETIEQQAESSATNTKQAVRELKKAADRQRSQRERLCCMLAAAILVLCFVLLPHMRS